MEELSLSISYKESIRGHDYDLGEVELPSTDFLEELAACDPIALSNFRLGKILNYCGGSA